MEPAQRTDALRVVRDCPDAREERCVGVGAAHEHRLETELARHPHQARSEHLAVARLEQPLGQPTHARALASHEDAEHGGASVHLTLSPCAHWPAHSP